MLVNERRNGYAEISPPVKARKPTAEPLTRVESFHRFCAKSHQISDVGQPGLVRSSRKARASSAPKAPFARLDRHMTCGRNYGRRSRENEKELYDGLQKDHKSERPTSAAGTGRQDERLASDCG